MTIDKDDFEAWRDNSITQEVMRYVRSLEKEAQAEWAGLLEAPPTPELLAGLSDRFLELQAQIVAARVLTETELSDIQPEEENDE